MKIHARLVAFWCPRPARWSSLLAWLCLVLALGGCAPHFVADYDAAAESEMLACARNVDRFWAVLLDTDPAARSYAAFKESYNGIEADLRILVLRCEIRPRNAETLRQAKLILELWQGDKAHHKEKNGVSDFLATRHRKQFYQAFVAMAKGEKAKDMNAGDTTEGTP